MFLSLTEQGELNRVRPDLILVCLAIHWEAFSFNSNLFLHKDLGFISTGYLPTEMPIQGYILIQQYMGSEA